MKFIKIKDKFLRADEIYALTEPKKHVSNIYEIVQAKLTRQHVPEEIIQWKIGVLFKSLPIEDFDYDTYEEANADLSRIIKDLENV